MTRRERAIEIIEECRHIHMLWAQWQRKTPNWARKTSGKSVGGISFHNKWAKNYGFVLEVLRSRR